MAPKRPIEAICCYELIKLCLDELQLSLADTLSIQSFPGKGPMQVLRHQIHLLSGRLVRRGLKDNHPTSISVKVEAPTAPGVTSSQPCPIYLPGPSLEGKLHGGFVHLSDACSCRRMSPCQ